MEEEQGYSCAICGETERNLNRGLFVDHCHKTGKIRGLLCIKCNMAMGLMSDDIDVLASAISYLQQ